MFIKWFAQLHIRWIAAWTQLGMAAGIVASPDHGLAASFYNRCHCIPYIFVGCLLAASMVLLVMIPRANGTTRLGEVLFVFGTLPLVFYVIAAWLVVLFDIFDTSQRSYALLSIYTGFLALLLKLWYTERTS